ncbi:MAG: tRNA pseudouridine(55) synthase TruB [Gemmatimonadetes bacterium]|nr:tRNA pseudouridine(55) synthase TruB [Gemmatimonadota bacterium]
MHRAGLLLVDKPAGITSHDVVAGVRRAAGTRRVGHAGTLDPFATGLLVVAVGPVTRLLPWIEGEPKVYEATIRLGGATDTDDATGVVIRTAPVPPPDVLADDDASPLRRAMAALTGDLLQRPPAYSAKHVDGARAHALARRGIEVQLPPVPVRVERWEWMGGDGPDLHVRVHCGAGTYIRALARDLGEALGSAAHCAALRRVQSGPLRVEQAVPIAHLAPGAVAAGSVRLESPLMALGEIAHEPVDRDQLARLRQGRPVRATRPGGRGALLFEGEVVAVGERLDGDWWQPRVVLADEAA